jgi:hypothetical protein
MFIPMHLCLNSPPPQDEVAFQLDTGDQNMIETVIPFAKVTCKQIPLSALWDERPTTKIWMPADKIKYCIHIKSTGETAIQSYQNFPPTKYFEARDNVLKVG